MEKDFFNHEKLPNAGLTFFRDFFDTAQSDAFYEELLRRSAWRQEEILIHGKLIPFPRLTAWYGDKGKNYNYSGLTVKPESWTSALLQIKKYIEEVTPVSFNSVLLNFYRNERDSVAWHSDDEPELGRNPIIGSVSFGETRRFQLKHKIKKNIRYEIELSHGSYLVMHGPTQHYWLHQIPKESKARKPRINLTFRIIKSLKA